MIKAIFFDKDGVLLNSMKTDFLATNDTLKHYGKKPISLKRYDETCWGFYVVDSMKMLFGKISNKKLKGVLNYYYTKLLKLSKYMKLYPNVKNVLKEVKKRKYKTAVITSTMQPFASKLLKIFKLKKHFDVVIAGNEVKRRKPYPDAILLACRKLKVKAKNIIYVGDNFQDIEAGRRAGCMTVGITTTSSRKELKHADRIIKNISELLNVIE